MTINTAPSHEMSLKEALAFAGLLDPAKVTRGRPSKEMTDNGTMLVRDYGYRIKGLSKSSTPKAGSVAAPLSAPPKAAPTTGKQIADIGPARREPELWEALVKHEGKLVPLPIGIKAVCNNCHNSLTYCPCNTSVVNYDDDQAIVIFRMRKSS